MAQKVQIQLLSDLALAKNPDSRVQANRTTRLALDERAVDLDLTDGEFEVLSDLLQPYIEAGRQAGRSGAPKFRGRARQARKTVDTARVRNWVREQGLDIKDRGRVPADLVEKYEVETGKSAYND
jgi:hypothetical protein